MRVSARIVLGIAIFLLCGVTFNTHVQAQTTTTHGSYLIPNADANVPVNHHSYSQIVLIDTLSAIMCEMTGVDPTNPNQPCLGVNPSTGKIALAAQPNTQSFGQAQTPQLGGALALVSQSIGAMYVPAVSSSQYTNYLADNFGVIKKTYAASNSNCPITTYGFGFCGLTPIFTLWTEIRNLAYTMLTLIFIGIGIGVMLRFRVDPRTVMTLQNQIPRVIIAILLITFSYAIAGIMIDLMWTVTYTGINFISDAGDQLSPKTQIDICNVNPDGSPVGPQPLSQVLDQRLLDQPISFTNTIFRKSCTKVINDPIIGKVTIPDGSDNGLLNLSNNVSSSLGDLVKKVLNDLLFPDGAGNKGCGFSWNPLKDLKCALGSVIGDVATSVFLWLTEQLVKLIVIVAILIALFRLWFELIKTYLTFIIFVILGPLWIVLGLIPGRPMGFEKWLRIIFSNLAVFPVVAFILVFARVLVDSAAQATVLGAATVAGADPAVLGATSGAPNVFIPPLIGNPNITTFSSFMGFGAIMLAPSIPGLIKERMKATGQGKYGATIAAGVGMAAGAAMAPGRKVWQGLNRVNPQTGEPEGALAVRKQQLIQKTPWIGRRQIAKKKALRDVRLGHADDFLTSFRGHAAAEGARNWFGRRIKPKSPKGNATPPPTGPVTRTSTRAERNERRRQRFNSGNEPSNENEGRRQTQPPRGETQEPEEGSTATPTPKKVVPPPTGGTTEGEKSHPVREKLGKGVQAIGKGAGLIQESTTTGVQKVSGGITKGVKLATKGTVTGAKLTGRGAMWVGRKATMPIRRFRRKP